MARRSALPHFLTALYTLLIVHASLQPFTGWMAPLSGTPFFLWAPVSSWRATLPDILINIVAYAPLGFAATWMSGRDTAVDTAAWRAIAGCALLSLGMEWAQEYLPVRRASAVDFFANVGGASIGGIAGALIIRRPQWRLKLRAWRDALFLP